jgi:hypothetical protein
MHQQWQPNWLPHCPHRLAYKGALSRTDRAAYTGTYTQTVDVIMTGTGTTQKCGGVNAVTGQTIEQMVDCETNCNSCALCVGYNWQLEGFNNAGVGSYKCVYKNGGSASANPGSSYFAKP